MKLEDVCLITEDVARLVAFYERVLKQSAYWEGEVHASFSVGSMGLAVYAQSAAMKDMEFSFPDWGAGHVVLGIRVDDVDAEYVRLSALDVEFITEPKTYPWGARSVHFRDPDGNIVTLRCMPKDA